MFNEVFILCAPNNISQWYSNHAEYTRKSQLTEDESKCNDNKKGLCGQK